MIRIPMIKRLSLLIVISATLAACSDSSILTPKETLLGNWSIVSIQNKAVIQRGTAKLLFHSDSKLSGSASCNNIASSYSAKNSALSIAPIATTRKMCRPALMEQESQLLRALSKVKRYQLHNGQLSMYDQQGTLQVMANRLK